MGCINIRLRARKPYDRFTLPDDDEGDATYVMLVSAVLAVEDISDEERQEREERAMTQRRLRRWNYPYEF